LLLQRNVSFLILNTLKRLSEICSTGRTTHGLYSAPGAAAAILRKSNIGEDAKTSTQSLKYLEV